MIQKDPEKYQTDNFKIKLDIELKHKDSKFCSKRPFYEIICNSAPDFVVLEHISLERNQEPAGLFGHLGKVWKALVTTFNGRYEFDGYVNCAPYFKQGRLMTKNMFIWYDSRGFWMIGNNQHFAKKNGEGNLRFYTRGTLFQSSRY